MNPVTKCQTSMFEYMGVLVALAKSQTGKGYSTSDILFQTLHGSFLCHYLNLVTETRPKL